MLHVVSTKCDEMSPRTNSYMAVIVLRRAKFRRDYGKKYLNVDWKNCFCPRTKWLACGFCDLPVYCGLQCGATPWKCTDTYSAPAAGRRINGRRQGLHHKEDHWNSRSKGAGQLRRRHGQERPRGLHAPFRL